MSLGVIIMAHQSLDRAIQVARHWVAGGCPVVMHIDGKVPSDDFERISAFAATQSKVVLCERFKCEWGGWGIVAASLAASKLMLETFRDVDHVFLSSGSCLPLRPVKELHDYLAEKPTTDFIESATTSDVQWTVGGLNEERFTQFYPFSWRNQRYLFDKSVALQRRLRIKRKIPVGIVPHLGSQWWCLTRNTLSSIVNDPDLCIYDKYFKNVWIPDESYFQTLARLYATRIESRSLTLSRFDFHGRPHVFYDDHLTLLRRTDCFVARKIWSGANTLYENFLDDNTTAERTSEPNPARVETVFTRAALRRTRSRPGLVMQSRYPNPHLELDMTASRYSVFEGFTEIFSDFESWLKKTTNTRTHGHLYAPKRVEFENRSPAYMGALSDSAKLRDYNPRMFLSNLIWNGRGDYQCFQFGPADQQDINWDIAKDRNASICVVTGAWLIPLSNDQRSFKILRNEAARYQKIEQEHINALQSVYARAQIKIWTLADFLEQPVECLQTSVSEIPGDWERRVTEMPTMNSLENLQDFVQNLNNQGMQPFLAGDFAPAMRPIDPSSTKRKSYVVR